MACNGSCSACGACGSCGGCARALLLTEPELRVLEQLGMFAFLPVARREDSIEPQCLEEGLPETSGLALIHLEHKGLVRLDYDRPLGNFDYSAYGAFPVHGSAALTQKGQQVVDTLQVQGYSEE